MSSAEYLREFVNERLTAAAEEIFSVFKTTIVQYEQEIDRQRQLLDIIWKPEVKLRRIEIPQQHGRTEEEVHAEQQLSNKDCNSSVIQKDPEPPQIKEEQEEREELLFSREAEMHEIYTSMWTSRTQYDDQREPGQKSDHRPPSHTSDVAKSLVQEGNKYGNFKSTRHAELKPKKRHRKNKGRSDRVYSHKLSEIHLNTDPEIPQQHECKKEVHAEQQLSNKDCNSSVIEKDPEPPQIKEEQEELCCIQGAERHVIHTFMLTSPYEESDQHESELKSGQKFLSYNFYAAESQEHKKRGEHEDSGSTRDAELKPKKRPCKSLSNDVHNPRLSENQPEDDPPDTTSKYCTINKPISGEGKQSPQPLCSHHITSQHVESLPLKLGTTEAALVSKPNVTSPVWKHFGFEPNERGEPANLDQPVCKICARKVPSKQGNTTNMIAHLDTHHRAIKALLPPKAPRGSLYVYSYQ